MQYAPSLLLLLELTSGCAASHGNAHDDPEAQTPDEACEITAGPLQGTFDGQPWRFTWGQEWPLFGGTEAQVFGNDVAEPSTCWPTPPRNRVYVQRGFEDEDGIVSDRILFLVSNGDGLNLEYEATSVRVEVMEAEIDRVRLRLCAREDISGLFSISGEIDVPGCSP